jgi:hypothetical protein
MATSDGARAKLAEFARQLRALVEREREEWRATRKNPTPLISETAVIMPAPTPSIDHGLAELVACAIEDRLEDNEKDLDRLLGLKSGPGHPVREERYRKIALRIHTLKSEDVTWPDIKEMLAAEGTFSGDERTLRRIYEDFFAELVGEEIDQRLDDEAGH